MTLTRDQLTAAVRANDAEVEAPDGSLESWCDAHDVSVEDLAYVANQRALRAAMIIDGQDPRTLSRTEFTSVGLSVEAQELLLPLGATWLDGFAAGRVAREDVTTTTEETP